MSGVVFIYIHVGLKQLDFVEGSWLPFDCELYILRWCYMKFYVSRT